MDPFSAVDTSAIEELMRIKHEEEIVAERLARMTEMKGEVSGSVYAKVEADYRHRAAALDQQARPLKQQARGEHRKLLGIFERLAADRDQARLDREEQEFRHKIGEYDEPTYRERLAAATTALQQREEEVAAADELKSRFRAAFRSDDDLASGPAPEPQPEPKPGVAEAPPSPAATGVLTAEPVAEPVAPPAPPPVPAPPQAAPHEEGEAGEGESTVLLPKAGASVAAAAATMTAAAATDAGATGVLPQPMASGATMVLPTARLVAQGDTGAMEYVLGTVTMIGRTLENQIRLAKPAISRRHCQIVLTPEGHYTITDLQSENGVYINGERVKERVLADGDLVQVGTERFVFHAH